MPLIEGYAITKDALPLDAAAMTQLVTGQVFALIGHRRAGPS